MGSYMSNWQLIREWWARVAKASTPRIGEDTCEPWVRVNPAKEFRRVVYHNRVLIVEL